MFLLSSQFKIKFSNQPNRLGHTPLQLAVGWTCSLETLLNHGAAVDVKDAQRRSPL